MTNNCPVCNKTGLLDYKNQEVICSQCNSNLRAYMLLNTLNQSKSGKRNFLTPISLIVLATSLLVIFFLNKSGDKIPVNSEVISSATFARNDSSDFFKTKLSELRDSVSNIKTDKEFVIDYTIKSGDCLSKIAYNFYGDWRLYSKIEADNNLAKPYKLVTGQVINIKMNLK